MNEDSDSAVLVEGLNQEISLINFVNNIEEKEVLKGIPEMENDTENISKDEKDIIR